MSTLYLAHHGILGQKWGVRRYQNTDGSLKRAGQLRYGDGKKFRASNGMEVSAPKTRYQKFIRKITPTKDGSQIDSSMHLTNKQKRSAQEERRALKEFNAHQKDMKKANRLDRKIEKLQNAKDAKSSDTYDKKIGKLQDKRDKAANNTKHLEKALRENNIERAYNKISDEYTTGRDRFWYSDKVRKKAATIYADNANMNYSDAIKKAKKNAWLKAAGATVATIAYTDIKSNGPGTQFVKGSIKKTMASKAARDATTKIGAKSLKKVAKNVYEWR